MAPCSTYYSFCGNAAKTGAASGKGIAGEIRSAVCNSWLKPIDMNQHPTFSSWVIYGAALTYLSTLTAMFLPTLPARLYMHSKTTTLMTSLMARQCLMGFDGMADVGLQERRPACMEWLLSRQILHSCWT